MNRMLPILILLLSMVSCLFCYGDLYAIASPRVCNSSNSSWNFTSTGYLDDNSDIMCNEFTNLLFPKKWYNQNWLYRTQFLIDNTQNRNTLLNTQFKILLSQDNFSYLHALPNGADIRFTDSGGRKLLNYWIERWDTTSTSQIWVNIPEVTSGSTTTIFMYYGNPHALDQSNGLAVFENHGFDDFESYFTGSIVGQVPKPSAPWNCYDGNPVLSSGFRMNTMYGFSSVVKDSCTFHMYFTKKPSIGHATSTDGLNWTVDRVHGEILANALVPMVWKENSNWYMLYRHRIDSTHHNGIGLATSSDGISWVKYQYNPILMEKDTSSWHGGIEPWGIIKVANTYYLFYSDWNSGFEQRKIGIAKSTDLYHWIKDIHNPIFTDGRFCCFPFKYGAYYYLIIPHYSSLNDYSVLELYRDKNPTFYPEEREFVRNVVTPSTEGTWNYQDQDTPFVLTDDIHRDSFHLTNNELWMYFAGAPTNTPATWFTGLTIEPDIKTALIPQKEKPLWVSKIENHIIVDKPTKNNSGKALFVHSSQGFSLLNDLDATHKDVIQLWMRADNNQINQFTLDILDAQDNLEGSIGFGRSNFIYHDTFKSRFIQTHIPYAQNSWYLIAFELNGSTYNVVVYNENNQVVFRQDGLELVAPVHKITISSDAVDRNSFVGYVDNFQVFQDQGKIYQSIEQPDTEELVYTLDDHNFN